jgi:hypothetical protein
MKAKMKSSVRGAQKTKNTQNCVRISAWLLMATFLSVAGCSSISFFPKATAQKAADKVIDDIWPASAAPADAITTPAATPSVATKMPPDATKTEAKK